MYMLLDNRLAAVAGFVAAGAAVADIGTDHGYLAVELYRRGCRRVIAADKNAGPCGAARRTVGEKGLAAFIEVRQGDGLAALLPGEVDTVCIAGMGGRLIADILAGQPQVLAELGSLVLQPQNASALLRERLYAYGWHIEDETLAKADGRVYQIIRAAQGREEPPSRLGLLLGPALLARRPEFWREHVADALAMADRALTGMRQGRGRDEGRLRELADDVEKLEALLR